MFRYPAISLIVAFFALGPSPFEHVHLAQANRAWAREAAMVGPQSNSPLKRLPVRPPAHDPASCPICVLLHAPMMVQHVGPMFLGLMARGGYLRADVPVRLPRVCVAAEQCRGPPLV